MSRSFRRWVVLGMLGPAALLAAGCQDRGRETSAASGETAPATGGAGGAGAPSGQGTVNQDGGTGGAGYPVPQETGTSGRGVTGGTIREEGVTPESATSLESSGMGQEERQLRERQQQTPRAPEDEGRR